MLRWARACRVPRGLLGPSTTRCSAVPSVLSSSDSSGGGRVVGNPRPLPLSYKLLDGEATLPAIVFLHGLFGSKTNFNSIAKAMAQRTSRRVLTVDARNHGDSPHSPDTSYEAMSQDLQGLLAQLGLVPCVLVGHSMGGKTAMLLALQRPEVVERLVAVDISPADTTPVSHFRNYMAAMKSVDIPEKVPRSHARKLADEQLSSVIQDPTVRQFLLTNLVEVNGHFSWRVNLDTLAQHFDKIMNFPQRPESYSGPTLFLLGEKSRFVQWQDSGERGSRGFPLGMPGGSLTLLQQDGTPWNLIQRRLCPAGPQCSSCLGSGLYYREALHSHLETPQENLNLASQSLSDRAGNRMNSGIYICKGLQPITSGF
ncbi:protein ABHD11 isoform X3 [Nannospalax galili]|uniref:protein ABHD11 isoform X3 n=1 Tax=Nannospalax galili TaxID=1026970 RepID=UPI00111C7B61|nr:protein ABHD11 isoform X3 [Nannospalax galili]